MNERTIRRWDGDNGTMFEIEATRDGETVYAENFKHAGAVAALRGEFGLGVTDAEAVVYNASQSNRAYEF